MIGEDVAEHLREAHCSRCLEVPVVEAAPESVVESVGDRNEIVMQTLEGLVTGQLIADQFLDSLAGTAQRVGGQPICSKSPHMANNNLRRAQTETRFQIPCNSRL